jgi:cobalt-zinc-cadmium efflux system protein
MQDRPASSHAHGGDRRRLGWALAITGLFMLVEVLGGLWSGSLALLADAGHMVADTGSLALAWFAAWLSERPANAHRGHGHGHGPGQRHGRAQVLAAFVNALALIIVVGWIAVEAVQRLVEPRQIQGATMLGIALLGLAANFVVYRILHGGSSANLNVEAARLHVLGDLLGSIAASAAAVVILTTGWLPVDALLSLVVAALILRSAWPLLRRSARMLIAGA